MTRLHPSAAYKTEQRRQLIRQAIVVAFVTAFAIGLLVYEVYRVTDPNNLSQ